MRDDRDDRRDAGDRPTPDDRDPERIDERVEDLEARVRELRTELGRPPEGPLGLPRPPTPREVLSFTGEYAIPTAIAMLEANVRALKALQQVIRLLDPERSVVGEERDRLQGRAADASRLTLDRLESALEDVETTIRESDLPREDAARDILEDARRINREIRDRVERERQEVDESRRRERDIDRERGRDGQRGRDERPSDDERSDGDADLQGGTTIELTDESEDSEDEGDAADASKDDRAEVDVEAELESIKDEMERRRNADGASPADASAGDATAAGEDGDDERADGSSTDAGDSTADGADASGSDADGSDADDDA
ncbi:hypothetical protein M0R89_14460 [Halorussus limi]|uniref:Uncharacterized protein n=1 Tax=Halorussus limi TaxID=2938695 RepID=A0A8U0HSS1_9EURY|nr:hypothetical protein [Halorussus limi]UPV73736.1 hypothetical protein M0R89_14460 [Halorussus limi]